MHSIFALPEWRHECILKKEGVSQDWYFGERMETTRAGEKVEKRGKTKFCSKIVCTHKIRSSYCSHHTPNSCKCRSPTYLYIGSRLYSLTWFRSEESRSHTLCFNQSQLMFISFLLFFVKTKKNVLETHQIVLTILFSKFFENTYLSCTFRTFQVHFYKTSYV